MTKPQPHFTPDGKLVVFNGALKPDTFIPIPMIPVIPVAGLGPQLPPIPEEPEEQQQE